MSKERNIEFEKIINELVELPIIQEMKKYRQHYTTSCLDHCINVAYYNYIICKKLGLDYISATRAGLLHDLFLYDWRKHQDEYKGLHAFHHPRIALNNSQKYFNINKKEEDMILKHMWPLTVKLPKYKESYIITIVDKYCTIKETFNYYGNKMNNNKAYQHAYIFLTLLLLPIF